MESSFQDYLSTISQQLQDHSLDNLDLLTAHWLAQPANSDLGEVVKQLFQRKRSLKFLERFLVISGSNNLSPAMKDRVLASREPFDLLARINQIAGKEEATAKIWPFKSSFRELSFRESFLRYETTAFNTAVGGLLTKLAPLGEIIRKKAPVAGSKQNTLRKLYQKSSVGKTYLSLDLRQANWNALRYWSPNLPDWSKFLEEILPAHPAKSLFVTSKMFRQITLGVALKKLGIIKQIEATQVNLISQVSQPIIRLLGPPFSESNDEVIFSLPPKKERQKLDVVVSILQEQPNSHWYRLTKFTFLEETPDQCYQVEYLPLDTYQKYRLLRCATPDKIESRLN